MLSMRWIRPRGFLSVAITVVLVAGLTSCGSGAEPEGGGDETPATAASGSEAGSQGGNATMDHATMDHAAMDHTSADHMVEEHAASEFESAAARFAENIFGKNPGDYGIAFAPDGETLYFTRALPGAQTETIYVTRWAGAQWNEPELAPFSGHYQDKEPYVSPDGQRIYFASRRPVQGTAPKPDFDIWYVEKRGAGWSEAVNLAAVNSAFNEDYPAVAADGTLLFARNDASDNVNLFIAAARDDRLDEPRDMGRPISTTYADADPWIAPDGSYIIFSSSRRFEGAQGQGDLYVSHRQDASWGEPLSLGLHVNNVGHDYAPMMSPDGGTFYFSRGFGGQVWMVPAALLDGLRKAP